METSQNTLKIKALLPDSLVSRGNRYLGFCIFAYGFYALLMLMESIDFAEMLHSPPKGYHATYGIEDVLFLIIDFVICSVLALLFLIVKNVQKTSAFSVYILVLLITVLRGFLIYYLYEYTDSENHFVPYIYKEANMFSSFYRFLFSFFQVFGGIFCVWIWIKIGKKYKTKKTP